MKLKMKQGIRRNALDKEGCQLCHSVKVQFKRMAERELEIKRKIGEERPYD
jgi:hypothetical protein